MDATTASRSTRLGFATWTLIGALAGFGMLSLLTIGAAVLALAAVAAALALYLRVYGPGLAGAVAGAAVPLAYVGWLNRAGPGEVCSTTAGVQTCTDEWSPWPWFAAAALCLLASVVLFRLLARTYVEATAVGPPGRLV